MYLLFSLDQVLHSLSLNFVDDVRHLSWSWTHSLFLFFIWPYYLSPYVYSSSLLNAFISFSTLFLLFFITPLTACIYTCGCICTSYSFLIKISSSHLRKPAVERFSFCKEAAWWSYLRLHFRKWIQIPCLQRLCNLGKFDLYPNSNCWLFLLYICLHWSHCILP